MSLFDDLQSNLDDLFHLETQQEQSDDPSIFNDMILSTKEEINILEDQLDDSDYL